MNIYDIAKLAGVSIATVSRVVNDSPKVSEKTKEKVRKVMEENHYTPNVFARGLGLDSMKTIGIVCPDVADVYMASAVSYLESNLKKYEYDCILYSSSHDYEKKKRAIELICQKRIDALILVGSTYAGNGQQVDETDYIREAAKHIPVFVINGKIEGENIYCIYGSDFESAYEATSSMIEAGFDKILFLSDSHSYSANQKLKGYETALKDHGLPVLGQLKLYTKNQIILVRDLLLTRRDLDFNAVMATDDGMAVGAVKYANARKLNVPLEINIIGYNNSEMAVCCEPELSSIDNKTADLCKYTIQHIMSVLQGEGKDVPSQLEIPSSLVKRCTTSF